MTAADQTLPSADLATCWVVCPMLRDSASFIQLRRELIEACEQHDRPDPVRFLVVDDSAGTDPDVVTLHEFEDVEVVTPAFNLGHQSAIVLGLRTLLPRLGPNDVIVTMDSDGEDKPADVPRLLQALDGGSTVLALAERTQRSESLLFRVMYMFFRIAFRVLTGTTVKSGNFAAQNASSLAATIHHPSYDLCYSSTLLVLRRPTTMVPCARGHRFAGSSRMNKHSLIAHGIRMLLPFSERIAVRTMVASVIAATAIAFGIALELFVQFDDGARTGLHLTLGLLAFCFSCSFITFVVLFSSFGRSRGHRVE